MEKFEVIIVGAGLAGLSAAYELAREGIEAVVTERGDYPGAKNMTGGRLPSFFLGDLTQGRFGGGFLYTNRSSLSLGLVIRIKDLAEGNPFKEARQFLEEFKERPEIAPLIAGGEMVEYSAHLISETGFSALIRPFADGLLVAGDAAGFSLNEGLTVRGWSLPSPRGFMPLRRGNRRERRRIFRPRAFRPTKGCCRTVSS